MANDPFNSFEVPTQMRQLAEQSLEQARKAVDGFITQAQKTVTTAEAQANAAQSNAKVPTDRKASPHSCAAPLSHHPV